MAQDDPRDRRISELETLLRAALDRITVLEARVAVLETENVALRAENRELRAKLGQNSSNSSKPPSSDPPSVVREKKPPTGRKRGGQGGHEGAQRALLPPAQVTQTIDHVPDRCVECDGALGAEDIEQEPRRHQIIDLPEITPLVIEHRCFAGTCSHCGVRTQAELPQGVPLTTFGPGLAALVAMLTGQYRMSKRDVPELLSDLLGIEIGLGSVSNLEHRVSAALAAPVALAVEHLQDQAFVNADETGWREGARKAWLWIACNLHVAVFLVRKDRSGGSAKALLGAEFKGILGSDRWSGYTWINPKRRQLCWAHLIRNFKGLVERGGDGGKFGQSMLNYAQTMFRRYAMVRDGTLARPRFLQMMEKHEREVGQILRRHLTSDAPGIAGTCKDILAVEPALWTFIHVEGIEPTNNQAERDLRKAVIWRKNCFGTDSERGSRFAERILTATVTLRKQGRNVFAYLKQLCTGFVLGRPAPSLLPAHAA